MAMSWETMVKNGSYWLIIWCDKMMYNMITNIYLDDYPLVNYDNYGK